MMYVYSVSKNFSGVSEEICTCVSTCTVTRGKTREKKTQTYEEYRIFHKKDTKGVIKVVEGESNVIN